MLHILETLYYSTVLLQDNGIFFTISSTLRNCYIYVKKFSQMRDMSHALLVPTLTLNISLKIISNYFKQ